MDGPGDIEEGPPPITVWQPPPDSTQSPVVATADPRRRFGRGVLVGFAAAVVVAAVGWFGVSHHAASTPFTLSGTLMLNGGPASVVSGTTNCHGTGGYSDIGAGAAVTVSDESGTLLAKGSLDVGHAQAGGCALQFEVGEVPGGKKFYQVEVSHRGAVSFTEAEAKAGVRLHLGEAEPSTSAAAPPSETRNIAAPPAPTAALPPAAGGMVYLTTTSGKTRCQISAFEVDCEAPFTNAPYLYGYPANGVRFTSSGRMQWVSGNLGDIPVVTIDYRTYQALGWTIDATFAGTTFTHDASGHSIFVSIDSVVAR